MKFTAETTWNSLILTATSVHAGYFVVMFLMRLLHIFLLILLQLSSNFFVVNAIIIIVITAAVYQCYSWKMRTSTHAHAYWQYLPLLMLMQCTWCQFLLLLLLGDRGLHLLPCRYKKTTMPFMWLSSVILELPLLQWYHNASILLLMPFLLFSFIDRLFGKWKTTIDSLLLPRLFVANFEAWKEVSLYRRTSFWRIRCSHGLRRRQTPHLLSYMMMMSLPFIVAICS